MKSTMVCAIPWVLLAACSGSSQPAAAGGRSDVNESLRVAVSELLAAESVESATNEFGRQLADHFRAASTVSEAYDEYTLALVNAVADPVDVDRLVSITRRMNGALIRGDPDVIRHQLAGEPGSDPVFFYINGMWTTLPDALANLQVLRHCVAEVAPNAAVELLFNASGGDDAVCFALGRVLSRLDPDSRPASSFRSTAEIWCGTNRFEDVAEVIARTKGLELDPLLVAVYTATVERELRAGRQVILIAHSQGNFFAESILRELSDGALRLEVGRSLRVLALASPTSYTGVLDAVDLVQLWGDWITCFGPPPNTSNCRSDGLRLHLLDRHQLESICDLDESGASLFDLGTAARLSQALHGLVSGYLADGLDCTKAPFSEGLLTALDRLERPGAVPRSPFVDRFDAEATGAEPSRWSIAYSGGMTREEAAQAGVGVEIDDQIFVGAAGKSARLSDESGAAVTITRDLPPLPVADIEFYLRVREGTDDAVNVDVRGGELGQGVALVLWGGDVRLRLGTVGANSDLFIGTYDELVWHRYRIFVDTVADEFSVWQDGQLLLGPSPLVGPGIGDPTNVDQIIVTTKNASSGTVWLDEVVVRDG